MVLDKGQVGIQTKGELRSHGSDQIEPRASAKLGPCVMCKRMCAGEWPGWRHKRVDVHDPILTLSFHVYVDVNLYVYAADLVASASLWRIRTSTACALVTGETGDRGWPCSQYSGDGQLGQPRGVRTTVQPGTHPSSPMTVPPSRRRPRGSLSVPGETREPYLALNHQGISKLKHGDFPSTG